MNTSITFVRRPQQLPSYLKWFVVGMLALLISQIWQLAASLPEGTAAKLWSAVQMQLRSGGPMAWFKFVANLAYAAVMVALLWMQWRVLKDSYLSLDETALRYHSTLPFFNRWLDWQLPLEDVRAGRVGLSLVKPPLRRDPLPFVTLQWGTYPVRRLILHTWHTPAASITLDQLENAAGPGLEHPDGLRGGAPADLQRRFDALPLVQALRQRGVEISWLHAKRRGMAGPDLTGNDRLRWGLLMVLGLLLTGIAGHMWTQHEHVFPAWPIGLWWAGGLPLALAAGIWLWGAPPEASLKINDARQIRAGQLFVAILLGLLGAWAMQAGAIGATRHLQPKLTLRFQTDPAGETLLPMSDAMAAHPDLPSIDVRITQEYWASLPAGHVQSLDVRRGWAGWWWQYDGKPLLEPVGRFYEQSQRQPNRAPSEH